MIPSAATILLPIGLGLLGFVEPCSIGATLVMVKVLEGQSSARQLVQMGLFAATRAGFIGLAGALATGLGSAFLGFQRAGWLLLGTVYVGLGVLFLAGMAGRLMVAVGPGLRRVGATRGSALLGVLLGLNIPACAAPLIFALLGAAAAAGAAGGSALGGFASLALFGLALSLPLILAVLFAATRRAIDHVARYTTQAPVWTGLVLIALGLWSIGLALFATIKL
ncbi:MAG: hypothetical protein KGL52_18925 [Rhodospirillales bacterium]|nr:hypothetical protein [Rhodospirillales bacterium]